jgi:hypothetical protein
MILSELTTQFLGLMNRRDLTANTSLTTTFINQAVMRIQRELRCPGMEKLVDITIISPYNGLVIPNDFIELIGIYPQSTQPAGITKLRKDRLERVKWLASFTGCPSKFAREGGSWVLGPSPGIGEVIRVAYYAELTPLVNPADENVISIIAWDLIAYAALAAACEYFKDSRLEVFEKRYQMILADIAAQADEDELDDAQMDPVYRFPADDTDNYEILVV